MTTINESLDLEPLQVLEWRPVTVDIYRDSNKIGHRYYKQSPVLLTYYTYFHQNKSYENEQQWLYFRGNS